jgi:hypothetical protein
MKAHDLGLKHVLKNWAACQQPSVKGKARLLNSIRTNRKPKESRITLFFLWAFNDKYNDFYLESLRDMHYRFLVTGAISAN